MTDRDLLLYLAEAQADAADAKVLAEQAERERDEINMARVAAEDENARLRRAIIDYRAGIMALNPALSAALAAHLPELQGGDSEF